jgi:micrococcal nuclease
MYEYRCNVLKIVDGDTVDVDIDLGFGVWVRNERVRIMGIDTPESRTSDGVEKLFGLAAKHRLEELLGDTAILKTQVSKDGEDMKGKFGRILGDFITDDDRMVTEVLIEEGHCVPYFGDSKELVQEQHAKNRERLLNEGVVNKEEYEKALAKKG